MVGRVETGDVSRLEQGFLLIERCASGDGLQMIVDDFFRVIRAFGFDVCAAGAWVGVGRNRAHRFYFNNWPADWLALYQQNNIFADDPVIAEARRRLTPFMWGELERSGRLSRDAEAVFALGRSYGWADGLAVPIHGPAGYEGVVSLAARRPLALNAREHAVLRAMALAVHDRCREAEGFGKQSQPLAQLTERELECMQWIAAGKSEKQVAGLVGISQPTVHFHIERAKKKLKIRNRTEAIALLVLQGSI
ncbi:MAG: helix-turn-helix transcriptional regulator [Acetobacteraceae bacterium]